MASAVVGVLDSSGAVYAIGKGEELSSLVFSIPAPNPCAPLPLVPAQAPILVSTPSFGLHSDARGGQQTTQRQTNLLHCSSVLDRSVHMVVPMMSDGTTVLVLAETGLECSFQGQCGNCSVRSSHAVHPSYFQPSQGPSSLGVFSTES